ncbi:hypothetical protein [Pseudomonas sp. SWRI179]|uniref:hypothetical protein n=1 Tax=Pseudomonas sp. SWRI179 TaxID=2745497 RepID=UPI001645EB94|nr:hypothetical protein [Pseudomonas sp. SWRI179]MBC3383439.1 hypothetical protein [Pseudomonas sp. SWRI179]MBC3383456.1 hypothetical protein [Pseudomonas sp. SWRI179]
MTQASSLKPQASSLKPQANSIASAAEHGPSPAQTSALSIGQRSAVEVMIAKQPTLGQQAGSGLSGKGRGRLRPASSK